MNKIVSILSSLTLIVVLSTACTKKTGSAAHTLTVNPSNNPTEVHLFGNDGDINQTDPQAPEIAGGAGTYLGDEVHVRALLKFDLSSIPTDAIIDSARLTLFSNHTPLNGQDDVANYGDDNSLLLQRVTGTWDYNIVSWQSQPATTTTSQVEIPHTVEPFLDLENINVTGLVTAMVKEGNNGFLLRLKSETPYTWRIFCSSKYSDAARIPKLEVFYKK